MITTVLDTRIAAVAPIDGVSVGSRSDKSTWHIDFKPAATPAQRQAAQAVVDAFDVAVEEQNIRDDKQAKSDKKDLLMSNPNKPATIQDLIDLELIR